MRDIASVEAAKAALKNTKTTAAVQSLPPGFIVGFRLTTNNDLTQLIVGKGVMNCRDSGVYHTVADIMDGADFVPNYVIKNTTYYVYMNKSKEYKIDVIAPAWDDAAFGDYHPILFQYRYLGRAYLNADGTWTKLLNQDPVVGNDIDAVNVSSFVLQTILANVTNYIIVGQEPDATPATNDIACFIYEDKIQIKKYNGATWAVQQQFGNTVVIGAEMYIGFNSFSGTSTLDAPGEGDTVHYINGSVDQYQEYTAGGWVVTANGIKIGGILAATGLFLSMIASTGCYHPGNPPTSTEFFPNAYFRVFNFNNVYYDQFGVDDWNEKIDLSFDNTHQKFGTHCLTGSSGDGLLTGATIFTTGQNIAIGAWFYHSVTGAEGEAQHDDEFFYLSNILNTDIIKVLIRKTASSNECKFYWWIKKSGSTVIYGTLNYVIAEAALNYFGLSYDSATDKLSLSLNNNPVYTTDAIGSSWAGGSATIHIWVANASGIGAGERTLCIDELLFANGYAVDINYFAQHYTHNVAWDTSGVAKADYLIRPGINGRAYVDGAAKITGATETVGALTPTGGIVFQVVDSALLAVNQTQDLAHGCGAVPAFQVVTLLCAEADSGYEVGEELVTLESNYPYDRDYEISKNVTNFQIRTGTTAFITFPEDSGVHAPITMNHWKFRIRYLP